MIAILKRAEQAGKCLHGRRSCAKEVGIEGMVDGFMLAAVWGTPDRILLEFEKRRDVVGEFELATLFRFGGIPRELAEQSIDLFAKEVLPVLKSWKVPLGQPAQ